MGFSPTVKKRRPWSPTACRSRRACQVLRFAPSARLCQLTQRNRPVPHALFAVPPSRGSKLGPTTYPITRVLALSSKNGAASPRSGKKKRWFGSTPPACGVDNHILVAALSEPVCMASVQLSIHSNTAAKVLGEQGLPTGETSWSHWAARDARKYFHVSDRWRERSVRALAGTQSLSANAPSSTLAVRPPTTRHHGTGPRAGTRDRKTQNYSPSKASSLGAIRHPRQ